MITLSLLVEALKKFDPAKLVKFSCPILPDRTDNYDLAYRNNNGVGRFCSYKGYYEHLAIEPSVNSSSISDVLTEAEQIKDSYIAGYRGGLYKMHQHTPIWCSISGSSSGLGITNIIESDIVFLQCTYFDESLWIVYELEEILNKININLGQNETILYSLDQSQTFNRYIGNINKDIFDECHIRGDLVYLPDWVGHMFCKYWLKIESNYNNIIIKGI